MLNHYETAFILTPVLSEPQMKEAVDKFENLLTKNGATILNREEWGLKKLAYPINYEADGYYVLINFSSEESFPAELDRVINITDGVLRSMIVAKGE